MIESFSGKYAAFSNFSPHRVGRYPTAEHAFQAAKTLIPEERNLIEIAATPGKAKRLGRQCTLRPDWEAVKLHVMFEIVWFKFFKHEDARQLLLSTGGQMLVEGNTWGDEFWGKVYREGEWHGQNWLGVILVLIRSEFTSNAADMQYGNGWKNMSRQE